MLLHESVKSPITGIFFYCVCTRAVCSFLIGYLKRSTDGGHPYRLGERIEIVSEWIYPRKLTTALILRTDRLSITVTVSLTRNVTPPKKERWSWRPSPTGRSARTGIPRLRRWSAGPIPDSMSSCGVLSAPAESTTSLRARARRRLRSRRNSTPMARFPDAQQIKWLFKGSCHKRRKPQAPTPQAPIRNHQTRKVANAKGLNHNTNLT